MVDGTEKAASPTVSGPTLWRVVLVLPLAFGIYGHLSGLAWLPRTPDQDTLFYVVGAAVQFTPLLLYAVAAFLVLTGRRPFAGWTVLFVCGLVLSAVVLYYLWQYREWGILMVVPPYLTVLALVELLRERRSVVSASG